MNHSSAQNAISQGAIDGSAPSAGGSPAPPDPQRVFSAEELGGFDGRGGPPVYVGLLGRVYDVTPAIKLYGPGGPYEVFAGRDATRGLATFNLGNARAPPGAWSEYSEKHQENARTWERLYLSKYGVVGTLGQSGVIPGDPAADPTEAEKGESTHSSSS